MTLATLVATPHGGSPNPCRPWSRGGAGRENRYRRARRPAAAAGRAFRKSFRWYRPSTMRCAASMRATRDTSGFSSMRRTSCARRSPFFRRGWNRCRSARTRRACSRMSRVCRRWPISFWTCSASTSRPTGCPLSISSPSGRKWPPILRRWRSPPITRYRSTPRRSNLRCAAMQGALERALTNLVQNAIQHGGRKGRIAVRVDRPATISVTDDGPGIQACDRERVFEPFYRLKGHDRGAGLGLNLVQEIVRRHDGAVVISEGPAGGTCVEMTFKPAHGTSVKSRPAFIAGRAHSRNRKFSAASTARNVRATSTRHIASTPTSTGDAV